MREIVLCVATASGAMADPHRPHPCQLKLLFCCRKWERQRQKLRLQHGGRFGDLSYALGGYSSRQEGGKSIDGPIERWKPDMEVVRATIQFAMETRRLQTGSQGTASIEEDNNEQQQLRIPTPIHN